MTRQSYVLADHELVVFWTPKAACTSIVQQLCFSILEQPRKELRGRARAWLAENSYGQPTNVAQQLCTEQGYTSLSLIREPYGRLVSAYLNKFVRNHGGDLTQLDQLEPFAREFFEQHSPSNDPYIGMTFRQFVQAVCTTIDNRGGGEPTLNHHWNTQVPFSFQADGFEYDHLYALPSAAEFFAKLGSLTDSAVENQVANAITYGEPSTEVLVDVASVQLATHQAHAKESFEDPELRQMVERSFAIDYDYLSRAL